MQITAAVLCPWARHFTPRKYWLITQEAMAPSRYDWKIVDWDVKPQHNQPTNQLMQIFKQEDVFYFHNFFVRNKIPAGKLTSKGQLSRISLLSR